jgi:hypothetical protein
MIIYRTKYFTTLTHYTNTEGAIGIMKNGFIDKSNQFGGISTFRVDNDTIRNDERYNMNTMFDNMSNRLSRLNKAYYDRGLRPRGSKMSKEDVDNYNLKSRYKISMNPLNVFGQAMGYSSNPQYKYLYRHNNAPTNKYNEFFNPDLLPYEDENGISRLKVPYDKNGAKTTVTFPEGYKQLSYIDGLRNGYIHRDNRKPVYRIITDTLNDNNLYDDIYNETRVPVSDLNNTKNKVEIPRGMYDGVKRVKRGYINDYNYFKPEDYNMEDVPTRKAVEDIQRKKAFLGRGHGRKNILRKRVK